MWIMDELRSWPCRVQIAEVRGDAIRWDWDRARVVKEHGIEAFKLKKRLATIPVSEFGQLSIDTKGRSVLTLLSPALGEYRPLMIDLDKGNLNAGASSIVWQDWAVLETRRVDELYRKSQTWWEKYASYMMLIMTAGVLAFTVIYVVQALEGIVGVVSGVSGPLAHSVDRLADLLERTLLAP